MGYDIKSIRKEFRRNGVFYTQPELAEYIKSFLPIDVKEVYDPTCGNGGLLCVFGDDVKKYGQELNPEQLQVAQDNLVNFEGVAGDTLTTPAFMDRKFENIVANYPFSIKWSPPAQDMFNTDPRFVGLPVLPPPSKADYAFVLHCLFLLSDTGTAVIMGFPGILYRGQKEQTIRQWLIDNNYIDKVVSIPGGKFVDTSVATCLLILRKNKTTTDVLFIDSENKLEKTVGFDEIKSNDYNLSVNTYIRLEQPKEQVDPIAIEMKARQGCVDLLRRHLKFSKMVAKFENLDFQVFVNELQCVLNEYKEQK